MLEIDLKKIFVLIGCFAIFSFPVYFGRTSPTPKKQVPLREALHSLRGWDLVLQTPLEVKISSALELDDYVNQSYTNGKEKVFLYIGYYLTSRKVGAAHDPLVCFPGQGWVPSQRETGVVILEPGKPGKVDYSSMVVSRERQKQLVVYWFQSYDRTSADTMSQKLVSLWKKLAGEGEDNAFVRVSMNVGQRPLTECHEAVVSDFIRAFYPAFLSYILKT